MKLFDRIYDKDAYIKGTIINEDKNKKEFYVLWDNKVYGTVKEEYKEIKVLGHLNLKKFFVVDILHTGNDGKEFESKVGREYERRKNKVLILDMDELIKGQKLSLTVYEEVEKGNKTKEIEGYLLTTTAFEKIYEENGYTYLRTLNSIYQLINM